MGWAFLIQRSCKVRLHHGSELEITQDPFSVLLLHVSTPALGWLVTHTKVWA